MTNLLKNIPRRAYQGVGEIVVRRVNWELIALAGIGVLAVANLMLYLRRRNGNG